MGHESFAGALDPFSPFFRLLLYLLVGMLLLALPAGLSLWSLLERSGWADDQSVRESKTLFGVNCFVVLISLGLFAYALTFMHLIGREGSAIFALLPGWLAGGVISLIGIAYILLRLQRRRAQRPPIGIKAAGSDSNAT